MSSCLVLQAKDKLYIGADTSSSVFIDNKLYRLNDNTKKLFLLDNNTVLYCAGNNSIAKKVTQYISSIYLQDDFSLTSLKNWLVEMYPYKNKDKTVYDVEILIATFKNNRTIVYQMSQYKNYDIISFEVSDVGVQILSAGIKNAECMSFAENELINKSGVKSIFRDTFSNLSCNYIGGYLDLYEISKNGVIKIFDNEKINEHGIQYVNDIFNSLSVSLNAEVLVSKLVMSENLWIENDSGTYKFTDDGFNASNGKNTIKIQPNKSEELFSIYKQNNKKFYIDSDGNLHFEGDLTGATGTFSGALKGGSINLGNGTFTVDKDGNMYAKSGTFSGDIVGGSININNVFTVDSSGNMNATSGKVGGWNISSNGLFSINSNGTYSWITPSSIEIYNPNGSGAGYTVVNYKGIQTTDIIADKIQVGTISHSSSQGDGFLHVDADVEFNGNRSVFIGGSFTCTSERSAHFRHTPYIDAPNDDPRKASYLAREKWCNDKFALKTDLSSYLTKSDASTSYAPKTHSHSKYTTESEVRSIVKSMVKSKYLS